MTIKTHGRMFTDSTVGITQLAVNDGTDGQALVTDGSGVLRFATVGAGGSVGSSVYVEDTRTGDGSAVTFNLSTAVPYEESIFVFIDGIAQPTTAYTLPTTTSITFSSAPIAGVTIRICHLGIASSVADNGITGAKIAMGADVAGDVLYYNGTDYQRLGIGTASQHLATNSGANAPEWVTPTAHATSATATAEGLVEIATQAEVNTGTDTARSITPATLAGRTGYVAQGDLKSITGDVSSVNTNTMVTGAGGEYGFWPTINSSVANANQYMVTPAGPVAPHSSIFQAATSQLGTTFLQRFHMGSAGSFTVTARSRYIQASPPYDIGDGECHSFIYLLIDNSTGNIDSGYHAPDPVWANNGPTCIRPEYKHHGKGYRIIQTIDKSKSFEDSSRYSSIEQEITNDFKNSDMVLIPHPFQGNDLTGKSVVLIDPCDSIVRQAELMKESGELALEELFHNDYVRFSNEHIEGRCTPCNHGTDEVMVVKPTWKNSK